MLYQLKNKIKRNDLLYWSPNKAFSYNVNFNFIFNVRSTGKTTQCVCLCVDNFINTGEEFCYIRRYKSETKQNQKLLNKFLDNVKLLGDGQKGGEWHVLTKRQENGKEITEYRRVGFLMSLSVQSNYKSSNLYDNVTNIIYDEAIIKRGGKSNHYLYDEVQELLHLISSIVRNRTNYKVWILGNNLDLLNPFYEFFRIPKFNKYFIDKERGIYIEESDMTKLMLEEKEKTPLYKLTKDTEFNAENILNKPSDTLNINISTKSVNDKLLIRLVVNKTTLNVYSRNEGVIYIERVLKTYNDDYILLVMTNDKPCYRELKEFKKTYLCQALLMRLYRNELLFSDEYSYNVFELVANYIK